MKIKKQNIQTYYDQKVREFGATPAGVDWNGEDSQTLRFKQLLRVIPEQFEKEITILDFGCGYGGLKEIVDKKYPSAIYYGLDLSEEMIKSAKQKFPAAASNFGRNLDDLPKSFDFVVASGVFNVRQNETDDLWKEYIQETLQIMNSKCLSGFAFNMLTSFSDFEKMKDYLYYASPMYFFEFCKLEFSKNVALMHDYDLYEFTILVRK